MEALWNEDGDRIKEDISSHIKYFSSFPLKLNFREREWMIEKMANGKKQMEMSTTKTWKPSFVVLVHSRSQGLFTLEGTGIWKMDFQRKDLLSWNEVIVGFYKERTAKVLPLLGIDIKGKSSLKSCRPKRICIDWLCTHFEGKNNWVYTHKGKQYQMQPKYIKGQTQTNSTCFLVWFGFFQ